MRLFAAASLLSVAFGQSQATTTALINAVQACTQGLSAAFQNNQQCSSTLSTVATFASPNTVPDLAPFCSSVCFGKIRNAYVAFGSNFFFERCVLCPCKTNVRELHASLRSIARGSPPCRQRHKPRAYGQDYDGRLQQHRQVV